SRFPLAVVRREPAEPPLRCKLKSSYQTVPKMGQTEASSQGWRVSFTITPSLLGFVLNSSAIRCQSFVPVGNGGELANVALSVALRIVMSGGLPVLKSLVRAQHSKWYCVSGSTTMTCDTWMTLSLVGARKTIRRLALPPCACASTIICAVGPETIDQLKLSELVNVVPASNPPFMNCSGTGSLPVSGSNSRITTRA